MRKSALIVPNASNRLVVGQNTSFFVFCIDATPRPLQARVDLKPATKHYWNQVVAALMASWPGLAERRLTKVTEIDARDWEATYQPQVSATRFNNTVDCLRAIFALGIKENGGALAMKTYGHLRTEHALLTEGTILKKQLLSYAKVTVRVKKSMCASD